MTDQGRGKPKAVVDTQKVKSVGLGNWLASEDSKQLGSHVREKVNVEVKIVTSGFQEPGCASATSPWPLLTGSHKQVWCLLM